MTQKEFEKLSASECLSLNGSKDENTLEAWRAGYIYLQEKIKKASESMYSEEFTDYTVEVVNEELDCFSDMVKQ